MSEDVSEAGIIYDEFLSNLHEEDVPKKGNLKLLFELEEENAGAF